MLRQLLNYLREELLAEILYRNDTNNSDQMILATISDSNILRTNTVRQIRFHLDSCPKKEKQKSSEWPAASVDSLLMSPNGSRAKSQHEGRRKFWKSGGEGGTLR